MLGEYAKSFITNFAGCFFGALSRRVAGIDPLHCEGHTELRAKLDAIPLKVVSRSLQAVVDVNGVNLPRPFLGAAKQQGGGIGAAAQSNSQ